MELHRSFVGHIFGTALNKCKNNFAVTLQLFWIYFDVFLGLDEVFFGHALRVILELCLSYFGVTLKLFSNYFEFISVKLELYSSHSSVHLVSL